MHYKVVAIVESERDEENIALYAEGVLQGHFELEDLSVFEIVM